MPLMLYLIRLLLAKATLLATMKIVYFFIKFSLFIALKIGLAKAILLYSSARYFMPFK
jgi:hypothetical protein